jgi:hypothetical protein
MFDLSEVGTHVLEGKILSLLVMVSPSNRCTGYLVMHYRTNKVITPSEVDSCFERYVHNVGNEVEGNSQGI